MKISEMKLKKALSGGPDWEITKIAEYLKENNARQVYIVENGTIIGVVGIADIVYKAVSKGKIDGTARDIMHSPVISADPSLSAKDAYFLMAQNNIYMIPVISNGEIQGEASLQECFEAIKNK